jgi:hypothetical protein
MTKKQKSRGNPHQAQPYIENANGRIVVAPARSGAVVGKAVPATTA